jgi:(S)-3,5-dihydroxyphenylglycine transaminase
MTGVLHLDEQDLHGSLTDPALASVGFLNEVMTRFPDAISFAPGAPNAAHLRDVDIAKYVDVYVDHLRAARGFTADRARRLLHEYGPSRGVINDLVAGALRLDQGVDVPAEAVVITVGAQEAMLLALRALRRSADDVLAVVDPCYVGIVGAARLLDMDVVGVGEFGNAIDFDQLDAACRAARVAGKRVRVLYVAPDFSNPSGVALSLPARRRLLEVARRQDFLLLEDMAYSFTAAPDQALPSLKSLDVDGRVIGIGTFAKVCLPGARVGFVVADQVVRGRDGTERLLADDLAALKGMTTVNTSPICQAVIGGMLLEHGGSLAALGRDKSELYRRNLALLLDELDRHAGRTATWNRPAGGFFVRVRLPVTADLALLHESASRFGVLWTPMSAFHVRDRGHDEIRLSCSYLDPDRIREGVTRLAAFFRSLDPTDN